MAIPSPNLSTLQRLRQGVQQRFEADLLARVQGARARGDWDGRPDTDLLVVADSQEVADGLADALLDVCCGADVIGLSRVSWDAKATSESPHWRGIHQQARQLLRVGP